MLSINKLAYNLTKKVVENPEYYRVIIETLPSGATVIDTGIKAHGGYEAGLMVTRIAMGGAGGLNQRAIQRMVVVQQGLWL